MPFQLLDLIIIGIMLISGLLALMRGFTREVLSLLAWAIAGLAALGAVLAIPVITTGSVLPAMIAHAALDIVAGLVLRERLIR